MKITTSLQLATLAAALAVGSASAQTAVPVPAPAAEDRETPSLLGQTYTGLEFGYTHHVESAPRSLRRFGFVSHKPLGELGPQVDATFRYDYLRGSTAGTTFHQHDITASLLRYWVDGPAKPFLHADLGWAWQKFGARDSSFLYRLGAGLEVQLRQRFAVTPFFAYRETPGLDDRRWNFGGRIAYRMQHQWSWALTTQMDDKHNIEYALGFQRRF